MSTQKTNLLPVSSVVAGGCMYHALASLTRERSWLRYSMDVSRHRFDLRVIEGGYYLRTIYHTLAEPATQGFWKRWLEANAGRDAFRLLITVPATRYGSPGLPQRAHMVAALVSPRRGQARIWDSGAEEMHTLDILDFIESRWGRGHRYDHLVRRTQPKMPAAFAGDRGEAKGEGTSLPFSDMTRWPPDGFWEALGERLAQEGIKHGVRPSTDRQTREQLSSARQIRPDLFETGADLVAWWRDSRKRGRWLEPVPVRFEAEQREEVLRFALDEGHLQRMAYEHLLLCNMAAEVVAEN